MKKRLILSLATALLLIATLALPAVAADERTVTGSVSVGETISITLTDASPNAGISFGTVTANSTLVYGDEDQSDGTPAIQVVVEPDTNVGNVDIGIMGSTTEALSLDNWQYSTLFDQSDIASITGTYVIVYNDVAPDNSYDFYHWITVPDGTAAGDYTASISYKAVAHGDPF
jgi:hypothetical protein